VIQIKPRVQIDPSQPVQALSQTDPIDPVWYKPASRDFILAAIHLLAFITGYSLVPVCQYLITLDVLFALSYMFPVCWVVWLIYITSFYPAVTVYRDTR